MTDTTRVSPPPSSAVRTRRCLPPWSTKVREIMSVHSVKHAFLARVAAGALIGAAVLPAPATHAAVVETGGVRSLSSPVRSAAALAAPAITVTPAVLRAGAAATVQGTGFTPQARLKLFVELSYFHNARVQLANMTAGPDGRFTTTLGPTGALPPGPQTLVVVSAGVDLARATIRFTTAPSIAPERLTVTPRLGMVGTHVTAIGKGFPVGSTVSAFTTESAKGPQGHLRAVGTLRIPAGGRVQFRFTTTGYHPESYDLIVYGPGGPQIGLPLIVVPHAIMVTAHA